MVQRGEGMGVPHARQPGDPRPRKGEGGLRASGGRFLQPFTSRRQILGAISYKIKNMSNVGNGVTSVTVETHFYWRKVTEVICNGSS